VLVEVGEAAVPPYPPRTPFVYVPWARAPGDVQSRATATKTVSSLTMELVPVRTRKVEWAIVNGWQNFATLSSSVTARRANQFHFVYP
jgi:hypothetical protein